MWKSNNKHGDARGVTIIEAMLAVAVLLIGVLAAVNIFPTALKISKSAEQETVAANLAQAEIEQMFSLGYDNITVGMIEAKHRLAASSSNPFYNYQRQTIAAYVDSNLATSTTATGLLKITATVYWTGTQSSSAESLPVSVLISQR